MDGEEVDVMVDGCGVFGIYIEVINDFKKGMIVVYGIGIYFDWEQIVQLICVVMMEYGWYILLIQMLILCNGVEFEEYVLLYFEVLFCLKVVEQFFK